jgi:hypothetical protein
MFFVSWQSATCSQRQRIALIELGTFLFFLLLLHPLAIFRWDTNKSARWMCESGSSRLKDHKVSMTTRDALLGMRGAGIVELV